MGGTALAVLSTFNLSAFAQRASENAVTSAEDAFGTSTGGQSIGLYSATSARGFNPMNAGNGRIEGLYFDQQAHMGSRLQRSVTMRVGLAAQSYPFPAPTGVAESAIYMPGDKRVYTLNLDYATPSGLNLVGIDYKQPLVPGKVGMELGAALWAQINDQLVNGRHWNTATIFRLTPSDTLEVIPFFYYEETRDAEASPAVYTGGAYLPPKFARDRFWGQKWADQTMNEINAGVIVKSRPFENWRIQGAVFRSDLLRPDNFVVSYRNTQADGTANLDILRYPHHRLASYSGEARASGVFTEGDLRHTVHFNLRGRETSRVFGGGGTVLFGKHTVGVVEDLPQPTFTFGRRDKDLVDQFTPGVAYVGQWANVGEASVGVQKSFYSRSFGKQGAVPGKTKSEPWLYNATLAVFATKDVTLYASYTRGIEEFGAAPDNATNAGEPMPASVTRQVDGGIRYRLTPGIVLVAGGFEVVKPYFGLSPVNLYTHVGELKHRGIEMSLTGKPIEGLNVVAGALFLQARVSGLPVDQGVIGRVPPGTPSRLLRLNLQYSHPTWHGFSLETQIDSQGSMYANRLDTLRVPAETTVSIGARYLFKVMDVNASIRGQVLNLFNSYAWNVDGASGRFSPSVSRGFAVRIVADL